MLVLQESQLSLIVGHIGFPESKLVSLTEAINDTFQKYGISTVLRQCHFLAQALHESTSFTKVVENVNYSVDGLKATFPTHFKDQHGMFDLNLLNSYARNPVAIASRVYALRMGNGAEVTKDGWTYRGRGWFEITGKEEYQLASIEFKQDFLTHPELIEQELYSSLVSGWFWSKDNLNSFADKDDILTITHKINGGEIGLDKRKVWLQKVKTVIK